MIRTSKSWRALSVGGASVPASHCFSRDRRFAGALAATNSSNRCLLAFTLIEIMVVVAIMAIVMLTSIPFIRSGLHKEALGETVREVEEVCASARRKAILQGAMAEIVFRPRERTFQVAGGAAGPSDATPASLDATMAPPSNSGLSGRISDSVVVDMLDVNLAEYKDSEEARVRFYPNGTSDELTLIIHNEKGQYFKIALEAVTGLPTFETDPSKFKLQ